MSRRPAYDPLEDMFEGLSFTTAGECVSVLARRLLDVPIAGDQRQILLQALGATGAGQPAVPRGPGGPETERIAPSDYQHGRVPVVLNSRPAVF